MLAVMKADYLAVKLAVHSAEMLAVMMADYLASTSDDLMAIHLEKK